jgi:hypothetical protein
VVFAAGCNSHRGKIVVMPKDDKLKQLDATAQPAACRLDQSHQRNASPKAFAKLGEIMARNT